MAAVPVSSAMPGMGRLAALRGLQRGVSSHSRLCRRHLSGRATASATREYCERTNVPLSAVLEPAGWEIGAVGFGGYRVRSDDASNRKAIMQALKSGVNVLDTAPNFMDGQSERLMGSALKDMSAAGELRREEVVLMSKFGYVQGSMLHELKSSGSQFDDMVQVSDSVWHCLSPDFMKHSLESSLKAMDVDHIDVFLVSNPEVFTKGRITAHVYERLAGLFCALEDEVARGRIGYYGVASNSLAGGAGSGETALSARQLVQVAKDAAGDNHHFKAIQYPFNVYEHSAVLGQAGAAPLVSTAREIGLWQFTQRALNAVTPGRKIRRLVTYPVESEGLADVVLAEFQTAVTLEEELADRASAELLGSIPKDMQTLALELTNHTHLLSDYFVLQHYLDRTVLPAALELCGKIQSEDKSMADWALSYAKTMRALRDKLLLAAQDQSNLDNQELSGLLGSVAPALKSTPDIAQQAVRIALGSGADCVLVGMTQPEYVSAALAAAAAELPLTATRPRHPGANTPGEDVQRIARLPVFAADPSTQLQQAS